MKKKHVITLAAVSALAATSLLAPNASAKPVQNGESDLAAAPAQQQQVFSATSINPDLAEALAAKGVNKKEPTPKKLVNGSRFAQPSSPQPLPQGKIGAVQKNLALLVKFPAENGHSPVPGSPDERISGKYFNDLLYGTSYNPYELPQFAKYAVAPDGTKAPTDRTLKNYYKEVSYGKVDVVTEDSPENVGWITAPHPYSYYFGNTGSLPTSETEYNSNGFGDYPYNVQGLVEDVVKAADGQVDFSKYADANGEIPGLFIIHEGTGGEWSADPQQFWSHKWELNEPLVVDGVKVAKYSMEPEYGGNLSGYDSSTGTYDPALKESPLPPAVGVYAHEFGHILGLPDLYDYGYDSAGVGAWTVMAGGSWARFPNYTQYAGNTPVHLDAWNKYFAGFVEPKEVTMDQITNATLPSSEDNAVVYKVTVPKTGGSEYFLFENRQLKGYDLGLTRYGGVKVGTLNNNMHGMLAYHVDDNVLYRNFWRPAEGQDPNPNRTAKNTTDTYSGTGEWHYGVGLIQADGKFELEKNLSSGNAGDAYPGTTGKTDLTFTKDFYSGSYYNNTPFFSVKNITEQNGVVKADFVPVQ
jgi:immune inhibitor A